MEEHKHTQLTTFGWSLAHFYSMTNNSKMCNLSIQLGLKDKRNKIGKTPLHLAATLGNQKIVKMLLSENCEVDATDMFGMTPLHWAVQNKHREIVSCLLNHNASVSIRSIFDLTPIDIAKKTEQFDLLKKLLCSVGLVDESSSESTSYATSPLSNDISSLSNSYITSQSPSEITSQSDTTSQSVSETIKPSDFKFTSKLLIEPMSESIRNKTNTLKPSLVGESTSDAFISEKMNESPNDRKSEGESTETMSEFSSGTLSAEAEEVGRKAFVLPNDLPLLKQYMCETASCDTKTNHNNQEMQVGILSAKDSKRFKSDKCQMSLRLTCALIDPKMQLGV